ncbi:transposase [Heyndrickxia vini]|uniref:Transposase n=1 Tax=Heyndrickxia vini TaxID=1476025 RepID=A0ABX7DZV0_9BACI|nr:transposase [Heyndrickxia vini]QQZ09016.1 transposase [Heyndrickxia vini]
MDKFNSEDKLHAVKRYLNKNESYHEIANSLGTDNKAILKQMQFRRGIL